MTRVRVRVPFMWRTEVVLVPVRRVQAALDGARGVAVGQRRWRAGGRAQEPVQAATTVLEGGGLLFLVKHFDADGLEHPGFHQGLTETDGLDAGHRLVAKETVHGDVREHHVHRLRAQEAVVVGLEVVAPALDLHAGLQVGDDAAPDEGGPEWLSSHAWFWWRRGGSQWTEGREDRQGQLGIWAERNWHLSTSFMCFILTGRWSRLINTSIKCDKKKNQPQNIRKKHPQATQLVSTQVIPMIPWWHSQLCLFFVFLRRELCFIVFTNQTLPVLCVTTMWL